MALTWPLFTAAERIAEVCGVIAWTMVMVTFEPRLQGRGITTRLLRVGAFAVAGLNVLALIAEPTFALPLLYSPAIRLSAPIIDVLELLPGNWQDVANVLTLMLLCGAQAAALAFALGHFIERVRAGMAPAVS
jgi:hypothetical protein